MLCPVPGVVLQVVFYYISQSKANNHAVREASCAVIAELMEKVDKGAVSPHVPDLLRALLLCFKDSSWPVRDAACTACGRCVRLCWAAAVLGLPMFLASLYHCSSCAGHTGKAPWR